MMARVSFQFAPGILETIIVAGSFLVEVVDVPLIFEGRSSSSFSSAWMGDEGFAWRTAAFLFAAWLTISTKGTCDRPVTSTSPT